MAKLTEAEKADWRRLPWRTPRTQPGPRRTAREYIEFATFAARFTRATKPVRFHGGFWKL